MITTAPGEEGQVDYGDGPMVRDPQHRQVPAHAALRPDAGLLAQVGAAADVAIERADLGRAARARVSPAGRHGPRHRPRQSARRRAHARHLRSRAQSALSRRARALRRRRAAVPRRRSRSQRQSRSRRRPRAEDAAARACASRRSRRRKRISIAGKRTGPTRASTARRSARSPRCLPRSSPRSARSRSSRFATTGTASARCISMAASRSRPRTTARRPAGSASASQVQWNDLHVRLLDPEDRPAAARASARAARLASHRTTTIGRRARRRRRWRCSTRATTRRPAHQRRLRSHPPARRRSRRPPHPRRARAREETRPGRRRRRRQGRARSRRADVPLPPPLSRTPPAGAADAPPGRPAHSAAHPLPRSHRSQNRRPAMNLVELDRALRQLRLSGMAAVLETRLRQAQTEKLAPIDLVSDARLRRTPAATGPPARAPAQAGALSRSRALARQLRLRFQQEDEPRAGLRARHRALHRAARGRALSRAARAPARATWPRPSAAPPSSRAIASSIARRTRCSRNSPTRRSTAPARTTSRSWRPCRC